MFTIPKIAFAGSSLSPVKRSHVGGAMDQAIVDYLLHQCRQNAKEWCIVSLRQIQLNLESFTGFTPCENTISDHLHRLARLGVLEIQKRTRRNQDGSLFTGRNLYRLSQRLFYAIGRLADKLFNCLTFWNDWKAKRPEFQKNPAPYNLGKFSPNDHPYGRRTRAEKTPDSTKPQAENYKGGETDRATPPCRTEEKESRSGAFSCDSPHQPGILEMIKAFNLKNGSS